MQAAPQVLLDLGCGSGISGAVLTKHGHAWIGCDISSDMLAVAQGTTTSSSMLPDGQLALQPQQKRLKPDSAALPRNTLSFTSRTGHNSLNHKPAKHPGRANAAAGRGLVVQSDMAQGIPLRNNSIDGAVSISAVQWLCHASEPHKALRRLFRSLHRCLKPEGKAVMQLYLTGVACCVQQSLHLHDSSLSSKHVLHEYLSSPRTARQLLHLVLEFAARPQGCCFSPPRGCHLCLTEQRF